MTTLSASALAFVETVRETWLGVVDINYLANNTGFVWDTEGAPMAIKAEIVDVLYKMTPVERVELFTNGVSINDNEEVTMNTTIETLPVISIISDVKMPSFVEANASTCEEAENIGLKINGETPDLTGHDAKITCYIFGADGTEWTDNIPDEYIPADIVAAARREDASDEDIDAYLACRNFPTLLPAKMILPYMDTNEAVTLTINGNDVKFRVIHA